MTTTCQFITCDTGKGEGTALCATKDGVEAWHL